MTPEELVQTVDPLIGNIGAASYFHPTTLARSKEAGLDGFRFYFLGRGGVLGNVEAEVIGSAFGYFHPDLVDKIWNSAKEKMEPREAGRLYLELARQLGRDNFADIPNLEGVVEALELAYNSANHAGLALSSGFNAEPLCDDLPGKAMQLVTVLREYRGSAHLVALRACGVLPEVAHAIRRPDDTGTFGWDPAPTATAEDHANYKNAQALTDTIVLEAYSPLSADQATALVAGLEAMNAKVSR